MRFDREWLVVACLLAAVLAGAVVLQEQRRAPADVPGEPTLAAVGENGTQLWPHTSRSRSFAGRTLAMNVVVRGAPDRTRRAMLRRTDTNWSRTELGDAAPEDVSLVAEGPVWLDTRGAARYTYVERADGEGTWLRERYQLGVGGYLGQRYHVRAYAVDGENWTAMQAHAEHWDWFRLRHTVDDVAGAREYVAADLASVGTDRRGADLGGVRAVVVVLALLPAGALAAGRFDRPREAALDRLPLPLALAGLVLGVRLVGVAVEGAFPGLSPKVIAGALYPVLLVGIPFVAVRFARRLPPRVAFALAAAGLWVGLLLDYAVLGVGFVRRPELLHRVALGLAAGLLAAAGGHDPEGRPLPLAVGLAGWLVALLLPLLGVL